MQDQAAHDVSRLLDKPGLKQLVEVAQREQDANSGEIETPSPHDRCPPSDEWDAMLDPERQTLAPRST
jgi:hypothetical protein